MGKKITATVDEVNAQKAELEQKINSTKADLQKLLQEQLDALEAKMRGEVKVVQGNVEKAEESQSKIQADSVAEAGTNAKADIAEAVQVVRSEIQALRPELHDNIQGTKSFLETRITDTDGATREAMTKELEVVCVRFDQELTALRASVEAIVNDTANAAAEALKRSQAEMEEFIQKVHTEGLAKTDEVAKAMAESLQQSVEDQEKVNKKQAQNLKNAQTDIDYKFQDVEKDIKKRGEETAKALQDAIKKAEKELAAFGAETATRFEGLDADMTQLRAIFSDVENVPTRKVEWVIKEAHSRLKVPTEIPEGEDELPMYSSYMSEPFDAAGSKQMQLELRYYRPTDPPSADQNRGDLALFLHAPAGTHIAFKLTIGKCSDTLEHEFRRNDPVGTRRIAFLKEQVHSTKFTLTVGVEVLECIYAFDRKPTPPEPVEGEEPAVPPFDSFYRCQRHINNRVLDQVKQQMDYFRKRTTRRIEWKLEEASLMKRAFPKGAPMRSMDFDAAGIEGMKLVFFPSGYDSAFEGYCSAFLYAPQGTTLRCTLQVGPQKRELNHTFEKDGQCGRANFLRFEEAVDRDEDCVFITLQIEEAHLDLTATMHHPPPPAVGCRSFASEALPMRPLGSTVKMQRALDFLPDCLQEVKILPSLWASKNYHETAVKVDGLRPVKDVRIRQRPRSGVKKSPSSPMLH